MAADHYDRRIIYQKTLDILDVIVKDTADVGESVEDPAARASEMKVIVERLQMENYTNYGQAGAMGPGAEAHGNVFQQGWNESTMTDDQLPQLARELAQLRAAMKESATESAHDIAVAAIAEAEQNAENRNGPATLERLKKAGSWALDVAKSIGVGLAIAALKQALAL